MGRQITTALIKGRSVRCDSPMEKKRTMRVEVCTGLFWLLGDAVSRLKAAAVEASRTRGATVETR
jgi:hypothetical protein